MKEGFVLADLSLELFRMDVFFLFALGVNYYPLFSSISRALIVGLVVRVQISSPLSPLPLRLPFNFSSGSINLLD